MNKPMLLSALHYHSEGLCVIPVVERDKKPALPAWEEYQSQCSTRDEVIGWFANGHKYNIGIVHGPVSSNYVAIDLDHDQGMLDSLRHLYPFLFVGRIEQSGSGKGYHIPLRLDRLPDFGSDDKQSRPRGNRTWKTSLGIVNIRARNCQTVAPPSIHPTGKRYKFIQKGSIAQLSDLDSLIEWLDKLAPPPISDRQINMQRANQPVKGDSLLEAVKNAWASAFDVFTEFGLAGNVQEDKGELRLLGNGGLLVTADKQKWYCFSDEMGGGVFEAWGYCRFGSSYDKRRHFRQVLLEMANAAGIDMDQFSRKKDEEKATAESIADRRYWSRQFVGYWERVR